MHQRVSSEAISRAADGVRRPDVVVVMRRRHGAAGGGYGVGGDVRLPDLSGDALLLAEFFPFYQNPTSAALLLLLQAVSSRTNLEGAKLAKKKFISLQ